MTNASANQPVRRETILAEWGTLCARPAPKARAGSKVGRFLSGLLLALTASGGMAAGNAPSTSQVHAEWMFAIEGGGAGTPNYVLGGEDSLCRKLLNYKNRAKPRAVNSCDATARLFGGLSDPPWKELDPLQHKLLIAKLQWYAAEGAARYFDRTTVPQRRPDAQGYYADEAERFIAEGGRLRLWLTAPYDPPRGEMQGSKKSGKLVRPLIQLRRPAPSGCQESMSPAGLFFVTEDLQGPDPSATDGFYPDQTIHVVNARRILLREDPTDVEVFREEGQLFRRICHLVPKRAPK
jgi:hypothetical protein